MQIAILIYLMSSVILNLVRFNCFLVFSRRDLVFTLVLNHNYIVLLWLQNFPFVSPSLYTLCINRLLDITEPKCIVAFCKNRRGETKNIAYYRLTAERYESWMQAIGRDPKENLSITHNAICSDHFTQDSHIYVDDKRVLKKFALLSVNLKPVKRTSHEYRSDGSTLQEGGIDLDISPPSTSFVTKVSKEFIKKKLATIYRTKSYTYVFISSLSLFGSTLQELNHISSKKKGNMSTDNEGLTGSSKRRRKFLRTFDNYAVSLRKLTKQVGDLREENKKI
ncbi:hypothetical protein NQ318_006647 [Aromia moschata]|uniref:THAP-type domain-containing protein n=1 Tax=Aromia moschata TaxID=1265417 RepID=A0AAV8YQS7_9CUCU|nr:hypothetical protein NQ318_006647 [Aromia moschata]